jgi:hypothetical protein
MAITQRYRVCGLSVWVPPLALSALVLGRGKGTTPGLYWEV